MTPATRVPPPYARTLAPPQGWLNLYCGQMAWKLMRQPIAPSLADLRCEIIYPADKPPSAYRWPVEDQSVYVWGHDAPLKRVGELVLELLAQGAWEVWLHDARYEPEPVQFTRREYLRECSR
jgi:hypothetical protein